MNNVSKLWEMYENGTSYQSALGLPDQIKENIDFFEGRQWGDTKNLKITQDYPRPVLNIVKMICRNKKAAVLASPVKLTFRGSSGNAGSELGEFVEYLQRDLRQDDMDNEAIDDGEKKGTYIYHYYWDESAGGFPGEYEGAVRCEIIDPRKVFFANPQERDEQKQKWVLIATREEVNAVKKLAEKGVDKNLISADDAEDSDVVEQEGSKLCTVLTRYFKLGGEVYFERAVKGTILHKPRSICPAHNEANISEDDGDDGLPEKPEKSDGKRNHAALYPIAVGVWEKRDNSIYGISEVEDIIPNQKAINRSEATKLLIGQAQSSSKIIAREGALQGQRITNSPLQVITDHCKTQANGLYTLPPANTSPILQVVTDQLMANTRTVTGSTEVLSGEVISSSMSGAAIAQLQSQAQKPIQELQKRFYRTRERTGKILVQFAKLFYSSKQFSVYDERTKQTQSKTFEGDRYADEQFDVICEAGSGTVYSDSMLINMLGDLLKLEIIDVRTYVQFFPASVLPNKSEILKGLEEREKGENEQLRAANEQSKAQIQQLTEYVQKQEAAVGNTESVVRQNRGLNELLGQLQAEYAAKINQANAIIQQSAAKSEQTAVDAGYLASQLAQAQKG